VRGLASNPRPTPIQACGSGVLKLLCLAAALLAALQPATARPHKLRVHDPAQAAELKAHGARLLADYGSFQLLETDDPSLAAEKLPRVEPVDHFDFIELNAGPLDTRASEVLAERKQIVPAVGNRLHLVQFVGPIKPEWRQALESTGVKIVHYIPQNAYLIYGDTDALSRFQAWAGTNSPVQWEGDYAGAYRIHPKARTHDVQGRLQTPAADTFTVQLLHDPAANPQTLALIDQLKLAPVQQQWQTLDYLNVVVRLPAARLAELATRPEVISIQPHPDRHMMDERQDQIMAGNLNGNVPAGAGYLAWLSGKGFAQAQFSASGFVVDVSDSGIDNGTIAPGHFGLYQAGDPGQASRVAYTRREGTANSGSTLQGCDGHGNLNSHIIGGYNDLATGFPHTDASGFRYGLGVCPFVRLGSSVIFDPDNFTSPNYANLQSRAYRDGARVSNNSWGADTAGDYDADAQSYDALVRDAQPSGASVPNTGNQEMIIVFAAGNAGPGATTVGSPGTAKNVIVAGAAENVHSHATASGGNNTAGNDGCSTPDTEADSANDMASFSSRGPCTDGRKKPDIVAPGTHITGGVAQSVLTTSGTGTALSCFKGTGVCALPGGGTQGSSSNFFPVGQQFYTTSSGTSHSTPAISGACALLRQYFINNSLTPPSSAMTKAFLVNSARYMTGTYAGDTLPSSSQGMGAVNLGTAFDGVARLVHDQVTAEKFTSSGQIRVISGSVADPSKPFRVTLAWTDAPGSTAGNAYNNDLDLTVTINGNTYKGNVFSGATSVTGGNADAKNNLESVFLPAGVSGTFAVTVTAANINSDGVPNEAPSIDQDYALVIYNALETSAPVISTDPQTQTVSLGSPVTFSTAANGQGTIGFQWYFNAGPIADATNSTYPIASAQTNDAGSYFVIATNTYGSATSAVATLTVAVAPLILTNPASLTVVTGSTAGFSVSARGAADLGYQWQFNGTNIAGAIASTYGVTNAQFSDEGSYSVVVSNYAGSVTSAPATLTVYAWSGSGVVISQIYGAGGNASATYLNDYVELYNRGSAAADLSSWSVQYASYNGSSWQATPLTGTIQPGHYYLVQEASAGTVGSSLPTPDAMGSISMGSSRGKVALVENQTALTVANPAGGAGIADFVGYGTATAFEGTGAAPAPSATTAIFRASGGATDTDDNSADFATGTPAPRNSSTGPSAPDLAVTVSHSGNFAQGDTGDIYTIIVTNVGAAASSGTVTVADTLPAGLTATAISGTGWDANLTTLTCTRFEALAAGAAYPSITVTVDISASAPARVTNSVAVSGGGESNTANNVGTDPTTITVVAAPAVTTGTATGVGTSTAILNGTVNPNGLSTTAQFQYGLTTAYGSTNAVAGPLTGTTAQAVNASLTGLSPGMTYHFRVSATNALGAANGSDATFTTTALVPDLTIAMTHAGNFTQGDTADTYTIIVTNTGTAASSGTVTVTDAPPSGLTTTSMSGTGWSYNSSAATCTRSDALAAGAAYPAITVTVSVSASAPGSVTNVATVSGGGETNPANNSASDPTTINSAGGGVGYAGVLAGWDVSGLSGGSGNYGASPLSASNKAPNLAVGGLTRGSGVTTLSTAAARAWGGNNFASTSESAATNLSQFATFSIAANTGYKVSFTNLSRLDCKRSNAGPPNGALQYQVGSGAFVDITTTLSYTTSGGALGPINLAGIPALQNVGAGTNVTFRIVNWGASDSGGNWYIFDVGNSTADDLEVQGTVVAACSSPAALTPTAAPASTVCAGTAITLTAHATGGSSPYTYQWKTNGTAISGATGSTCSIASPTVADALNYTVDITSSCGGTASTSPALALIVNTIPSTPTAGNSGPVCAGSALTLSTPAVSGATYSWTGPNSFTSSAQNPTVSSSATVDLSGTYYVTVAVSGCPSAAGSTAVTVDPAPVGGTATPAAAEVRSGTGTNITLTGQTGSIVKWQSSTDGNNWSDIASTANPLSTGTLTQTTAYRAVVQSGVCAPAASGVATVNVIALVAPTLSGIEKLSATSIKLTFSGPQSQTYKVLEATDVNQGLSNWNVLTTGTFSSSPETFTNTAATDAARFYRITSP
jgi:uncharacterized repeat protein (TIGR01451 family)